MSQILKYTQKGYDITAIVSGTGFDAFAEIMYKPYGAEEYLEIGKIYKTTTGACGTARDTSTWHHRYAESPIAKKSWHEAAKDLYSDFRKETP